MQIFEVARISNFTERELKQYEAAMMNRYDQRAIVAYAKEQGEAKGLKKGILQTAKSMLKNGLEPALVARITKLPKEQIIAFSKA